VAVAVVVALAAGGGSAWALGERGRAGDEASRERVASALAAGVDDEATATRLAGRSAGEVSRALLDDSQQNLAAALPQAQGVLDASAGQVADDAVRQALATAIARAQAALDAGVAPVRANALAGELVATAGVVATAQAQWLEAKKAEEAAAADAARSGASGSTGMCVDTYVRSDWPPSEPTAAGDGTNGNMNIASMTPLSWTSDPRGQQYWLVTDATAALEQLNAAFRASFGHDIPIDLAYRDFQTQQEMYDVLGSRIAAKPRTSNHGWGTAIDVPEWKCQYGFGTEKYNWLRANAPAYGWWHPDWARQGSSRAEYWHYEYDPAKARP
jgi:hypothetical protein